MKRAKWVFLALALTAALGVGLAAGIRAVRPARRYAQGLALRAEQRWDEAAAAFEEAGDHRDAAEQILETRYQQAQTLYAAGDYARAYAAFLQASGYRDADEILAGDEHFRQSNEQYTEATAPFRTLGETVSFGRYEQDGDPMNGSEPIEWIVLDEQDGRALLISRYGLDCQPFHTRRALVNWGTCSLRSWLNREFLEAAFDAAECGAVLKTRVDNSRAQGYEKYGASSGSDTQDRVFLLSYAEAWRYFPTNEARQTTATAYARARGAYTSQQNGNCWWWLRSSGNAGTCAMNVHCSGVRGDYLAHDPYAAVRPAIWVDLRSPYFSLSGNETRTGGEDANDA
uniref:DUF6273 domain-containing protein n=1 Tax=uncultured bacterium Contig99 TaxID=1393639 RepID=W0FI38_9BACT|nr:hypothetical protein [uncultured bacterium Contig99]